MELTEPKRTKTKYTTHTLILYKTGKLPDDVLQTIPRSTRRYWNNFTLEEQFGYGTWWTTPEEYQNFILLSQWQHLKKIAKCLCYLLLVQQIIISAMPCKKQLYQQHAFAIDALLQKAGALVDIRKCLRWVGLSSQQYYHWVKDFDCLDSIMGLCRKKHPFQLLKKEVAVMKDYLTNPLYCIYHWRLFIAK